METAVSWLRRSQFRPSQHLSLSVGWRDQLIVCLRALYVFKLPLQFDCLYQAERILFFTFLSLPFALILTPSSPASRRTSSLRLPRCATVMWRGLNRVRPNVIKYFNRDIFSAVLAVQSVKPSLSVTLDELFRPNPSLLSTIPSSSSFNFSHSHPFPVNNLYKRKILLTSSLDFFSKLYFSNCKTAVKEIQHGGEFPSWWEEVWTCFSASKSIQIIQDFLHIHPSHYVYAHIKHRCLIDVEMRLIRHLLFHGWTKKSLTRTELLW